MKVIFSIILCFFIHSTFGQDRFNEFQIRASRGNVRYQMVNQVRIVDDFSTFDTSMKEALFNAIIPIELRYELSRRINVGIEFQHFDYLNKFNSFGLGVEGSLISNADFRLYSGFTMSKAKMIDWFLIGLDQSVVVSQFTWSGYGGKVNAGMMIFGKKRKSFGVNFNVGYSFRKMKLSDIGELGNIQGLPQIENSYSFKGTEINLGFVFRIRRR